MSQHFTYLSPIIPNEDWQKYAIALALGGGLVLLGKILTAPLRTEEGIKAHIVPSSRLSLFGFFDAFVEGFVKFQDSILGKKNRKYAPFTGSIFIFILLSNLIGLIPGMPAVTTTVWVNVGLAIAVFLYFNYLGIREHGVVNYIKHFMGPVWWLAWFIFPIEIFGTCLRILTLNLRLYWNIRADHLVLEIITNLLGVFAFPVYLMGTFVSFMQATVFTILTMVYILIATQHGEEEHH